MNTAVFQAIVPCFLVFSGLPTATLTHIDWPLNGPLFSVSRCLVMCASLEISMGLVGGTWKKRLSYGFIGIVNVERRGSTLALTRFVCDERTKHY